MNTITCLTSRLNRDERKGDRSAGEVKRRQVLKRRVVLSIVLLFLLGVLMKSVAAQTDSLIVRDGFGDPGSAGNIVSVELKNSVGVGRMQFTLNYNSSLLSLTNVLATERTGPMGFFDWQELTPGQVTVHLWDPEEGDTIEPGTGSIADFSFDVDPDAHYGTVQLNLSGVVIHDAEGGIVSATTVNGTFVITEPDIEMSILSHDYGQVVVGDTSKWDVVVTNIGTKDLVVNYMAITPPSGDFTIETPYPQTLSPGGQLNVTLTFTPTSVGLKSADVYIVSDDPDEPVSTITLSGAGIAPEISVSATSHDFGSVIGFNTETWVLTIFNLGSTASLKVSGISSSHSDFDVLTPTFPRVVPIDGSLDVTIGFTPSQLGPISGTLQIGSNDPDEGMLTISLVGTGYYPPAAVEVIGGLALQLPQRL